MEKKLMIIGSLNFEKECQDRVRVFRGGISPGLRATDYKDPPKFVRTYEKGIKDIRHH